jgi:hypothetical protein
MPANTEVTPTIVTFKWKSPPGYRSTFEGVHVNTLASMVRRHYAKPHRFLCITDDPTGIDEKIETMPLWKDHSKLPSPHSLRFPSCYRRLKIFSAEAKELIGERIIQLDLDTVITDDVSPLFDREEDFIAWGDTNRAGGYNGSLLILRAGTRTKVWDTFHPIQSPQISTRAGAIGSDQGWISVCLGKDAEAKFTEKDGVYSYRNYIEPRKGRLPGNARMVMFHGRVDPWSKEAQKLDWVREHYK